METYLNVKAKGYKGKPRATLSVVRKDLDQIYVTISIQKDHSYCRRLNLKLMQGLEE